MKGRYYFLASLACVLGCTEGSQEIECQPACDPESQICVDGVCQDKVCDPGCNPFTEECVKGVCQPKSCNPACDPVSEVCKLGVCESACKPACGPTEACVYGTCEPKTCDPACGQDEVCVGGVCEHKDACKGEMCKDAMTYCDQTTGRWAKCELGSGCHLGVCLAGMGIECEENTCSEDGLRACVDGKWSSCKSLETCVDGACKLSEDAECAPETCSEDGVYFCDETGTYQSCADGFACKEGHCTLNFDQNDAMLWTVCNKNSDCAVGECVMSVSVSRKLSAQSLNIFDVDSILLSDIDDRIPEGYGVCSADCTKSADKCDSLTTGKFKFSCQVVVTGDSPYPPKDSEGNLLTLPFHEELNLSEMEIAPYASLCRPQDVGNRFYSETFCASCNTSLECAENEVCFGGACMPKCSMNAMCPVGFSCVATSEAEDALHVCSPNSGTCGSCLDLDGDGQGYGDCIKPGFDCDPIDPETYYTTDLPKVCTHDVKDTNCNGKIDSFELFKNNSSSHCRFCNDECYLPPGTYNITRSCELYPGAVIDDHQYASFNPNDESTYLAYCHDTCAEGYADCDGDATNGCERQLAVIIREGGKKDGKVLSVTATDADSENPMILHSVDEDQDLQGDNTNADNFFYCCGSSTSVCYAMPNTNSNSNFGSNFNEHDVWYRTNGSNWDKVVSKETPVSYDVADCNDGSAKHYTSGVEMCDNIDNDCDDTTKDGVNDQYKDPFDGKVYKYGDACTVRSGNSVCGQGTVTCDSANGAMICKANKAMDTTDNTCNTIDENCDGSYNEWYVPSLCIYKDGDYYCGEELKTDGKLSLDLAENGDGSINICNIYVRSCVTTIQNGVAEKAEQKHFKAFYVPTQSGSNPKARAYDFYGDGIDSNCDGVDYDLSNTVYLNRYAAASNVGGTTFGDDNSGSGEKDRPYATLNKAFEKACDKGITNYCFDIFVAENMERDQNSSATEDVWGIDLIRIPAYKTLNTIKNNYETIQNLYQPYTEIKDKDGVVVSIQQACMEDGCFKQKLLPTETYPPKEAVRIYGGFNVDTKSDINTWTPTGSKTNYIYNANPEDNARTTELIKAKQVAPLSVKFSNMNISLTAPDGVSISDANNQARYNGVTMVGLSCGIAGCRHITMDNSSLTVVGMQGVSTHKEQTKNTLYGEGENSDSNGKAGGNFYEDNKQWWNSQENFKTNRANNATLLSSYSSSKSGNDGREVGWLKTSSDKLNAKCPDGRSPRGGAPGSRCCKNRCDTELNQKRGNTGNAGGTGGDGGAGKYSSVSTGDKCSGDSSYRGQGTPETTELENDNFGKNGGHGHGGLGGTFVNNIACSTKLENKSFWVECDSSRGNGKVGQSGGGGGGGAVYNCRDKDGSDDAYVYAGSGGAGGCGGYAGRAGGMGASVVGFLLTPPNDGTTLDLTTSIPEKSLTLQSGAGGAGQAGQMGRYGGFRGYGFGYGNKNHCHKAMAGGLGGTGGGGGGGAGGLGGHVYPMVFICNRDNKTFNAVNASQFESCGFKMSNNWYGKTTIYLNSVKRGTAGGDGAEGATAKKISDNSSNSSDNYLMLYQYVESHQMAEKAVTTGGTGGSAGQHSTSSNNNPGPGRTGHYQEVLMLYDTKFKP